MNITTEANNRPRAGVRRAKRLSARIDMTPMVDLGFLLITFFVMTAKLAEPTVVGLNMPKESTERTPVPESGSFTILINGPDELYVYYGNAHDVTAPSQFIKTSMSPTGGLRDLIQQRQRYLDESGFREGRKGLMFLIKPSPEATYRQLMDVLDEAFINIVEKYVIVSPDAEDVLLMEEYR